MDFFYDTESINPPLSLIRNQFIDIKATFLSNNIIVTLPSIMIILISFLSILNRSFPSIFNYLWDIRKICIGSIYFVTSALWSLDFSMRFSFLLNHLPFFEIYLNFIVIIQIFGFISLFFCGLFSFNLIGNSQYLFGLLLEVICLLISLYLFGLYYLLEPSFLKEFSFYFGFILISVAIEGAGMLHGISAFKILGEKSAPIVDFIYKKIVHPFIIYAKRTTFQIYQTILLPSLKLLWNYLILPVFKFIVKILDYVYNILELICKYLYFLAKSVNDYILYPIILFVRQKLVAIVQFIKNPPPPPKFIIDGFNLVLSLMNGILFVLYKIGLLILDLCLLFLYLCEYFDNNLIRPSIKFIEYMSRLFISNFMFHVLLFFCFMGDFFVLLFRRIMYPVYLYIFITIEYIYYWICWNLIVPSYHLYLNLSETVIRSSTKIYFYIAEIIVPPLINFTYKYISKPIQYFVWNFSFALLIFTFGCGFLWNAYINFISSNFTLNWQFWGYFLGSYTNINVALILLSRHISQPSLRFKLLRAGLYLYRNLGFYVVDIVIDCVSLVYSSSVNIVISVWISIFNAISSILQLFIITIKSFLELVFEKIYAPLYNLICKSLNIIWNNPYVSIMLSTLMLHFAYSIETRKIRSFFSPVNIYPECNILMKDLIIAFGVSLREYLYSIGAIRFETLNSFNHHIFNSCNTFVTSSVEASVFSLTKNYLFGWAIYLIHLTYRYSLPTVVDSVFIARSCMKMIYYPLLFFSFVSYNTSVFLSSIWVTLLIYNIVKTNTRRTYFLISIGLIFICIIYSLSDNQIVLYLNLFAKTIILSFGGCYLIMAMLIYSLFIYFESKRRASIPNPNRFGYRHQGGNMNLKNKPDLIRKIQSFSPSVRFESSECNICLEDFDTTTTTTTTKENNKSMFLNCGHKFHQECVLIWLDTHNSCPVCREHVDRSNFVLAMM